MDCCSGGSKSKAKDVESGSKKWIQWVAFALIALLVLGFVIGRF